MTLPFLLCSLAFISSASTQTATGGQWQLCDKMLVCAGAFGCPQGPVV
jgi:hypothetical protein